MKFCFTPTSLLVATVLSIILSKVDAKLMSFMNPFEEAVVVDHNAARRSLSHAQEMKKLLQNRRVEATLRKMQQKKRKSGQEQLNIPEPANESLLRRGLSSKKTSGKGGKGSKKYSSSSGKGGKGSKKSSKKSSGKGATPPPTPGPTMATPQPTMMMTAAATPPPVAVSEDQGPMSFDELPDIDNTPPPIASEDQKRPISSEDSVLFSSFDTLPDLDTLPKIVSSEDQRPVSSEDFRAPPMVVSSEDQGPVIEDGADASSDGGASNANPSTGQEEEEPSTGGNNDPEDDGTADANDEPATDEEPDESDATNNEEPAAEEEPDQVDGDATNNEEEPTEEPAEILTDEWEFTMVRTEASSADSEEDFNMTSVIAMAGVLYGFDADGEVNMDTGVGEFSALCVLVSMDDDVLCTYKVHFATEQGGIGELIARGHVVDHQDENLALVTGTAFDLAKYTKGGTLVMQPSRENPLALICSLTLRYAKDTSSIN